MKLHFSDRSYVTSAQLHSSPYRNGPAIDFSSLLYRAATVVHRQQSLSPVIPSKRQIQTAAHRNKGDNPTNKPVSINKKPYTDTINLLDITLPPGLLADDLWRAILTENDSQNLLVTFHKRLKDEYVRLKLPYSHDNNNSSDPTTNKSSSKRSKPNGDHFNVALHLTYHTPITSSLPLVPKVARNSESIKLQHLGKRGFTLTSVIESQGVPLADKFKNHVTWTVQPSADGKTTSLIITGETRFQGNVVGPIKDLIAKESKAGMIKAYALLEDLLLGGGSTNNTNNNVSYQIPLPLTVQDIRSALRDEETIDGIKDYVAKHWPTWSRSRYWLIHADRVPSPEQAIALLTALTFGARPLKFQERHQKYCRDALVVGLVECLRLKDQPRTPSYEIPGMRRMGAAAKSSSLNKQQSSDVLPSSLVCDAISVLGFLGVDLYWQEEMEALCQRLPELVYEENSVKKVTIALWGLGGSRHWTDNLVYLENLLVHYVKHELHPDVPPKVKLRISAGIERLAFLGYVPDRIFHEISGKLLEGEPWPAQGLSRMAWALAITDICDLTFCRALLQALATLPSLEQIKVGHFCMLHQFFLSLQLRQPELWDEFTLAPSTSLEQNNNNNKNNTSGGVYLSRELIERAEKEWKDMLSWEKTVSSVQQDAFSSIKALGYAVKLEPLILGISVDMSIPELKLAVEVDGPSHFTRNVKGRLVGNILWKKKVLSAAGWKVLNINALEFGMLKSWQRKKYLSEEIDALIVKTNNN